MHRADSAFNGAVVGIHFEAWCVSIHGRLDMPGNYVDKFRVIWQVVWHLKFFFQKRGSVDQNIDGNSMR